MRPIAPDGPAEPGLMRRLPALTLLAALAAGCASAEPPAESSARAQAGSTFLSLQRRGFVGGVAVKPIRVEEDSRCPRQVQCIQAGTVRLSARVGRELRLLTLRQPLGTGSGTWLTLCEVLPHRLRPVPIKPAHYRFGFVLHRGAAPPDRSAACAGPTAAPGG